MFEDTPAARAAERLSLQMSSWSSFGFTARERTTLILGSRTIGPLTVKETRFDSKETADGKRFYERFSILGDGSVMRSESFTDGKRFGNIAYDRRDPEKQQMYVLARSFGKETEVPGTYRPAPYMYYYYGKIPLPEALPKAAHEGTDTLIGRDCDRFVFRDTAWGRRNDDYMVCLDKATGIPLKVVYGKTDSPIWTWEALSLDKVDDYYFPKTSEYTSFVVPPGSAVARENNHHEIVCEDVNFNHSYPAATFWKDKSPEVDLVDNVRNRVVHAHPTGPANPTGQAQVPPPTPQLDATVPADWSSHAPVAGIALAASLLVLGVFLKFRR